MGFKSIGQTSEWTDKKRNRAKIRDVMYRLQFNLRLKNDVPKVINGGAGPHVVLVLVELVQVAVLEVLDHQADGVVQSGQAKHPRKVRVGQSPEGGPRAKKPLPKNREFRYLFSLIV